MRQFFHRVQMRSVGSMNDFHEEDGKEEKNKRETIEIGNQLNIKTFLDVIDSRVEQLDEIYIIRSICSFPLKLHK